jgi:leucyl/phenylalanyl-tRNA---protein transferase
MPLFPSSRFFPPAEDADSEGIVGFGGKLSSEWLLDAYRHGIFPWPVGEPGYPLVWWSPDPRAIIEFERFHVPRRLHHVIQSGRFQVTFDRDFAGVIHGCATAQQRRRGTWITPEMETAYTRLFQIGFAHSVEAWDQSRLAGGVYGVAIGGLFAAESMFYRVPEASKVALVHLVEHLRQQNYLLLDIQQLTPHTARFGANEIPRREYLRRLVRAVTQSAQFHPKE